MTKYIPVIGLEVHVELKTKSKMFCQCSADYFRLDPNSNTCPVCLGLPGALPVPNKRAIEMTVMIGQALNCQINRHSKFDRKHYFYPDLPKGYQISQYDEPIAINGYLEIGYPRIKRYRIRRVHLEEDTGKLIHQGVDTLIDFNRSGVPLVEIVTEPDFQSSADVKIFLEELYTIIKYLGVSDADMEKGSMRLEPNISLKLKTDRSLPNYKVEIKNINSFRYVKKAIDYEIKRQEKILISGRFPEQETRGYNEKKGVTYNQRTKEDAHDYRYFPEPDIPPIELSDQNIKFILKKLPEELPQQRLHRYLNNYHLNYQTAYTLTRDRTLSDFFEKIIQKKNQILINEKNIAHLLQFIANLIVNKKLNASTNIKSAINKVRSLLTPKSIDMQILDKVIEDSINLNKKAVADYKSGKTNAIMYLVGQVMKRLKGQADARQIKQKLQEKLS